MLVLSRRQNETLVFPGLDITIQVVSIKKGVVRLGIVAPDQVRVLRGELPDLESEWADTPLQVPAVARPPLQDLVTKRLAIVRQGLDEVLRSITEAHPEEAELLLDKLDEDLQLLRQRLHTETAKQTLPRLPIQEICPCDLLDDAGDCQCAADLPF